LGAVIEIDNIYYADNISWTTLDDEVFIFNEITNELILLKGLYKDFWLLLSTHSNLSEIINILIVMHENDSSLVKDKVIHKVSSLLIQNLIVKEKAL
jgi:hypothetical protein